MLLTLCQEVSTLFFHTGPLLEAFQQHSNAPFFIVWWISYIFPFNILWQLF